MFTFVLTLGMLYALDFPPFSNMEDFIDKITIQEIECVPVDVDCILFDGDWNTYDGDWNTYETIIPLNDTEVLDVVIDKNYGVNKSTVLEYEDLLTDDFTLEDV